MHHKKPLAKTGDLVRERNISREARLARNLFQEVWETLALMLTYFRISGVRKTPVFFF